MINQPFDAEKYILVTTQQDFEREIKLLKMIKTTKEYRDDQSVIRRFITATGWTMVKFGLRLVDRSSKC